MHAVIIALLAVAVALAACSSNSKTVFNGKAFYETSDRQAGGSSE